MLLGGSTFHGFQFVAVTAVDTWAGDKLARINVLNLPSKWSRFLLSTGSIDCRSNSSNIPNCKIMVYGTFPWRCRVQFDGFGQWGNCINFLWSTWDMLYAQRIGLLPENENPNEQPRPIWNFGVSTDPIYMGRCNGITSSCYMTGYAMESVCHTGYECTWTRKDVRMSELIELIGFWQYNPCWSALPFQLVSR